MREARLIAAFAVAAALIRLPGLDGDLWIDEIWSLRLAQGSILDVVFRQRVDNNHLLNTFYLFLVQSSGSHVVFRLLAYASGVATVVFLGLAARRFGRGASVMAMLFGAASYPLVHFSTEARGYAPAMCAAVAAFWALDTRRTRVFQAAVIAGVLSHPTFLYAYAGLLAWSVARQVRLPDAVRELGRMHMAPACAITAVYVLLIQGIQRGGGVPQSVLSETVELLAWTTGTRYGVLLVLAVAVEIVLLRRAKDAVWWFFAVCIFVAPATLIALFQARYFSERYLLVVVPFALLLAAAACGRLLRHGVAARVAVAGVAVAFAAAQVAPIRALNRGRYSEAAMYLASKGDFVKVAGDHPFRTTMVLDYYAERLGKQFRYGAGAEWFLLHRFDTAGPPPARLQGGYVVDRVFTYAGLSGWEWVVYRRTD